MNLSKQRQAIRCIRDGFKNIWNHLFMSISSVLTLTITLSLCALFVLFAENTNQLTRQIESEVKIFAEFNDDITNEEIETTINEIEDMNLVSDVIFRTSEEEFKDITERMAGGDATIQGFLTSRDENPLPPTLTIEVDNVDSISELNEQISEMPTIQFTNFGEDSTLESFVEITSTIRTTMIVIVVVLLVLAVFLIQNTIRITIHSRQDELKIMQLVGASIPHVTLPFIVEGIIIGVIGATLPILITLIGYPILYEASGGVLIIPMLQLADPRPLIFQISFVVGIISIIISILGSLFAVGKYVFKN